MSSRKSTSKNNVNKAFSKLEDSLSKVQEAMPKLELAHPALKGSLFDFEPAKKVAEWYIETAEDFANHGIELQERSTRWAKHMPWAPLFEAQSSIARALVKNSAMAARNLWQVQSLLQAIIDPLDYFERLRNHAAPLRLIKPPLHIMQWRSTFRMACARFNYQIHDRPQQSLQDDPAKSGMGAPAVGTSP